MRLRHVFAMLLGPALIVSTQAARATTGIDAYFPYSGLGYDTLGVSLFVELSDIQNYKVLSWTEHSAYFKDGVAQTVSNTTVVKSPAQAGGFDYALTFSPAPPVPASKVGMWSLTATLTLQYFTCSVYLGIPVCGEANFCVLYGAGEPCLDTAQGYIH